MEIIRELQLLETSMLREFDTICRKYNISYFVTWGTALGAKRHQGFIPWDDDIDIGMLRADYEKLRKIPESEWKGIKLVDAYSNCFYHEKVFPRIYKPGTVFESKLWTYTYNKEKIRKPVWMDIFLFDYVDSKEEAEIKAKKAYKLHVCYYYSKYWTNIFREDSIKRKVGCLARNIIHIFLSIKKPSFYLKNYFRLVKKDTGKYLISFDNWTVEEILQSMCEYDDIYPVGNIRFEDVTVMSPRKVDKLLEQFYGDYMQLPPIEKRIGHLPQTIEL